MKVIYVTGDDYSALEFENDNKVDLETWERASNNCIPNAKALEFDGEVDPKFISFIQNDICDYDSMKTTNFYVVKE